MVLQTIQMPKMIMGYTLDIVSLFGMGKYNVPIDLLQYQGQPRAPGPSLPPKRSTRWAFVVLAHT